MADPFTMAAVGGGLNIAGGLMGASGAMAEGESTAGMYNYKAGVAQRNAAINRQNSDYALEVGGIEARRSGLTTGFTIAKQKVAQSGNGFDINTGSAQAVRDSTNKIGVEDQTTIRENAGRKALSFRQRANDLDAEASADIIAGKNAKSAAKIKAVSTLIGTAGSVASKWTQASQVFGGGGSGVTLYDENQQVSGFMR